MRCQERNRELREALEKEVSAAKFHLRELVEALEEEARESESPGLLTHNASRLNAARNFLGLKPWGK